MRRCVCGANDIEDPAAEARVNGRWCTSHNIANREHLVDIAKLLDMGIGYTGECGENDRFAVVFDARLRHEFGAYDASVA